MINGLSYYIFFNMIFEIDSCSSNSPFATDLNPVTPLQPGYTVLLLTSGDTERT